VEFLLVSLVSQFEVEFKRFIGAEHAVATCNGTVALHTALLSLGIGEGDKVITTPFSFIASANSILYCGATPIFADIDPDTYCLDPVEVRDALEEHDNVKAVLCVHLFGNVCDMKSMLNLAQAYNVGLIEDCAQALGRNVGNTGHFGCYSFYESKNLWTFEGGMLTTPSSELAKKARMLINHGRSGRWTHEVLGYNYRMPEVCALLGLQQLKRHRKAIMAELGSYCVDDGFYPYVIYEQPVYKKLGFNGHCPNAEKIAEEVRTRLEST